jgi:hypothetical protein
VHTITRGVAAAVTLILAAVPVLVALPAEAASPYNMMYVNQPNGRRFLLR